MTSIVEERMLVLVQNTGIHLKKALNGILFSSLLHVRVWSDATWSCNIHTCEHVQTRAITCGSITRVPKTCGIKATPYTCHQASANGLLLNPHISTNCICGYNPPFTPITLFIEGDSNPALGMYAMICAYPIWKISCGGYDLVVNNVTCDSNYMVVVGCVVFGGYSILNI